MIRKLVFSMVVVGSALITGCFSPQRTDYAVAQQIGIASDSPQADQLWEVVQDTLRRHRFRLDRVDRRAGVITTIPETSQHFFEFWRHDVDTWSDLWEATLNPIRRRAEVSLTANEDEQAWEQICVVVHKEQLSSPDRQFNSTGAAYQFFGDSLPSTTGLARVTAEHDRWLDVGRDAAMEDRLLRLMLAGAGLTAPEG